MPSISFGAALVMAKPLFCMHCHERADQMLLMAALAEFGCKGSCESAHICYCSEDGKHKLVNRDEVDRWVVRIENRFDDTVYVPKGTPLTQVWKYAKQQHRDRPLSHLRKWKPKELSS